MRENNQLVLLSCELFKAFGQAHTPLGRALTKKGHTRHHACPHKNTPVHMSSGPLSSYKGTIYSAYQDTVLIRTHRLSGHYRIVVSYLQITSHLILSSYHLISYTPIYIVYLILSYMRRVGS